MVLTMMRHCHIALVPNRRPTHLHDPRVYWHAIASRVAVERTHQQLCQRSRALSPARPGWAALQRAGEGSKPKRRSAAARDDGRRQPRGCLRDATGWLRWQSHANMLTLTFIQ